MFMKFVYKMCLHFQWHRLGHIIIQNMCCSTAVACVFAAKILLMEINLKGWPLDLPANTQK
jgi:hypothetical protein